MSGIKAALSSRNEIRCTKLKCVLLGSNRISDDAAKPLIDAFPARRVMNLIDANPLSSELIMPLCSEVIKVRSRDSLLSNDGIFMHFKMFSRK